MKTLALRLYASLVLAYSLASCLRAVTAGLWAVFLVMLRAIWSQQERESQCPPLPERRDE